MTKYFSTSPRAIARYLGQPMAAEPLPKLPRIKACPQPTPILARDRVWQFVRDNPHSTVMDVRRGLDMAESTAKHALRRLGKEGRARIVARLGHRNEQVWEVIE